MFKPIWRAPTRKGRPPVKIPYDYRTQHFKPIYEVIPKKTIINFSTFCDIAIDYLSNL